MKNNPAFHRVIGFIDSNNITKQQFLDTTDDQILNVMALPVGDHTRIASVRRLVIRVFLERQQAARIIELRGLVLSLYPNATAESLGKGVYRLDLGVAE